MPNASSTPIANRLYSLDALRGFDMFWIMGAEQIIHHAHQISQNPFLETLSNQMIHPDWNGFAFYDLIFPLFLFIAGLASPYSVVKEIELGKSKSQMAFRIFKRTSILILLGLVINQGIHIMPISEIRFGSVLGRIGIAYMFANFIFIYSKKEWMNYLWFAGLLIGYYLTLKFTSAPGFPTGDLTQAGNFASYLDRLIMPGKLYLGNHDPEGLASSLPAISTGLLGILVGNYIKNNPSSGAKKCVRLSIIGIIFILISLIWNLDFPINKNLWSSSFVMLTGGISILLFTLFYYIIDVKGYRNWAFFFKVIGVNSILIYISGTFIDWQYTTNGLFGWVGEWIGNPFSIVAMSLLYLGVKWGFLYALYKMKIFLKV
jgi:predicted acyltransferase